MEKQKISNIYWQEDSRLEFYSGTTIKFNRLDDVEFRNIFIPGGDVVVEWYYKETYWIERKTSYLPYLENNQNYTIERDVEFDGLNGFASIIFFDDQNKRIESFESDSKKFSFKVPYKYKFYKIQFIVYGEGSFVFHNLRIVKKEDENLLEQNNEEIITLNNKKNQLFSKKIIPSNLLNEDTLNVIFIEPEINSMDLPLYQISKQNIKSAIFYDLRPSSGFYSSFYEKDEEEYIESIINSINKIKKDEKISKINVIGYGPISSNIAYRLSLKYDFENIYISKDIIRNINNYISKNNFNYFRSGNEIERFNNENYINDISNEKITFIPESYAEKSFSNDNLMLLTPDFSERLDFFIEQNRNNLIVDNEELSFDVVDFDDSKKDNKKKGFFEKIFKKKKK